MKAVKVFLAAALFLGSPRLALLVFGLAGYCVAATLAVLNFGGAQLILDSLEECNVGELCEEFCPAANAED